MHSVVRITAPNKGCGHFICMKGVKQMRKIIRRYISKRVMRMFGGNRIENIRGFKLNVMRTGVIRNLFDTALYTKQWGSVYITNDETGEIIGEVRDYLDFVATLGKEKAIDLCTGGGLFHVYVKPIALAYHPSATRGEDDDLYYGVNISRNITIRNRKYYMGDKVYLRMKTQGVYEFMLCVGCGTPIKGDDWIETFDTGHIYCSSCEGRYYNQCESCGEYFDEEIIEAENDCERHICNSCYDNGSDDWFQCEDCHHYFVGDSCDVHDRYGDEIIVCENCRDYNYCQCDECGEWHHENNGHSVDDYNWICDSCLEDGWHICERCDTWHREEDMHEDDSGDWYCDECWCGEDGENLIGYHDNRGDCGYNAVGTYYMEFLNETSRLDDPTIGVENEIAGAGESSCNAGQIREQVGEEYIICSTDSSLRGQGFELVSCPADLYNHKNTINWEDGFRKARSLGYTSHDNGLCGLHTHLDRTFFADESQDDVETKFVIVFRNNLWWLKNFSRRDDRNPNRDEPWYYCEPNGNRYLSLEDKFDKESLGHKRFMDKLKEKDHYLAINFTHTNTIELRLFRGTLKYNTFIATLEFVDMLARLIKGKTNEEATEITLHDFKMMALAYGYESFLSYIEERNINAMEEPKRKLIRYTKDESYHYIDYPM